jgi:putative FmdB family regulatory protein
MPIYEYKCEICNTNVETKYHFEFGPECESCGRNMTRVWHAPGIQFKGSGFYKTDNR